MPFSFLFIFLITTFDLSGSTISASGLQNNCVIETSTGEKINSLKINVNEVGQSSLVSLRPERVAINSKDGNYENNFEASVEELIYLGDHVRTRVKVCGNDQFIVKVPNSSDQSDLKEGAKVKLSWRIGDTRALDYRS